MEVNKDILENAHVLEQEYLQKELIRNDSFAFMFYLSLIHTSFIVMKISQASPQHFKAGGGRHLHRHLHWLNRSVLSLTFNRGSKDLHEGTPAFWIVDLKCDN